MKIHVGDKNVASFFASKRDKTKANKAVQNAMPLLYINAVTVLYCVNTQKVGKI